MGQKIIGFGSYLPERIMNNNELEQFVNVKSEWIEARTGITQRHIAHDDEGAAQMGFHAAAAALDDAQCSIDEIDLIIVATSTPDNTMPSTATQLQAMLRATKNIPAFDINAACSGFIYGIDLISDLLKAGRYRKILFVCVDKMSSIVDWQDRMTAILFGDGAGALVFENVISSDSMIVNSKIWAKGSEKDLLYCDGGVSSENPVGKLRMKGREVFKRAINYMEDAILNLLEEENITCDDIAYFVPHQANIRIINCLADKFNFDSHKIVTTVTQHANCSAASIALALANLKKQGKLKDGDLILTASIGAGLTWGAALIRI